MGCAGEEVHFCALFARYFCALFFCNVWERFAIDSAWNGGWCVAWFLWLGF